MVNKNDYQARIAFIGIGLMGLPMATNLLKAGFHVTAWNRTKAKADALREHGANVAETAADAVKDADYVITMLDNGPVVDSVVFDGELPRQARPGTVFIDMSSIAPDLARTHAKRLLEAGFNHLDAPVSGGTAGAEAASLTIMVGGSIDEFERAEPIFRAMGRSTYVGEHGAGQLSKLANQTIVAVTIGVVAEALLLAAAGGADPAAVREALRGGFADSRILDLHGERMLERNFIPGGAARNQLKDLRAALDSAEASGLKLPMTERISELFTSLVEEGGDGYDHSALLLQLEKLNPKHRVGNKADQLPN